MSIPTKLSALGLGLGLAFAQPAWAAPESQPTVGREGVIKLSAEQIAALRIEVAPVGPGNLLRTVRVPGNVMMDPDRIGHVPAKVIGTVVELRKRLGDVVQKGEVVAYLGALKDGLDRRLVADIARRFDLDLGRRYREYSRGNKQKLAIAIAFMHRPQLLILDEPTSGLDPLNQQEFYRLLRGVREDGATVFLSSHVLSEVEHVCDRVGIIRAGRLVQTAGLRELHHMRVHRVELEFEGRPPTHLAEVEGVEDLRLEDGRLTCIVRGAFAPFMRALAGVEVVNLVSHEPSLEDVFLASYREQPELTAPA